MVINKKRREFLLSSFVGAEGLEPPNLLCVIQAL